MKREELIKRVERIKKDISKRLIIPRAINVIKEHGKYDKNSSSFFGFDRGSYLGIDIFGREISINYLDHCMCKGGGNLDIIYKGIKVFGADPSYKVISCERDFDLAVILEGFYVLTYTPGDWEEHLKKLSKIKLAKPQRNELDDEEIDKSLVSRLKKRFPSLELK